MHDTHGDLFTVMSPFLADKCLQSKLLTYHVELCYSINNGAASWVQTSCALTHAPTQAHRRNYLIRPNHLQCRLYLSLCTYSYFLRCSIVVLCSIVCVAGRMLWALDTCQHSFLAFCFASLLPAEQLYQQMSQISENTCSADLIYEFQAVSVWQFILTTWAGDRKLGGKVCAFQTGIRLVLPLLHSHSSLYMPTNLHGKHFTLANRSSWVF